MHVGRISLVVRQLGMGQGNEELSYRDSKHLTSDSIMSVTAFHTLAKDMSMIEVQHILY